MMDGFPDSPNCQSCLQLKGECLCQKLETYEDQDTEGASLKESCSIEVSGHENNICIAEVCNTEYIRPSQASNESLNAKEAEIVNIQDSYSQALIDYRSLPYIDDDSGSICIEEDTDIMPKEPSKTSLTPLKVNISRINKIQDNTDKSLKINRLVKCTYVSLAEEEDFDIIPIKTTQTTSKSAPCKSLSTEVVNNNQDGDACTSNLSLEASSSIKVIGGKSVHESLGTKPKTHFRKPNLCFNPEGQTSLYSENRKISLKSIKESMEIRKMGAPKPRHANQRQMRATPESSTENIPRFPHAESLFRSKSQQINPLHIAEEIGTGQSPDSIVRSVSCPNLPSMKQLNLRRRSIRLNDGRISEATRSVQNFFRDIQNWIKVKFGINENRLKKECKSRSVFYVSTDLQCLEELRKDEPKPIIDTVVRGEPKVSSRSQIRQFMNKRKYLGLGAELSKINEESALDLWEYEYGIVSTKDNPDQYWRALFEPLSSSDSETEYDDVSIMNDEDRDGNIPATSCRRK